MTFKYRLIVEGIVPELDNPFEDRIFKTEDELFWFIGRCLDMEVPYSAARSVLKELHKGGIRRVRLHHHMKYVSPFVDHPGLFWAIELIGEE